MICFAIRQSTSFPKCAVKPNIFIANSSFSENMTNSSVVYYPVGIDFEVVYIYWDIEWVVKCNNFSQNYSFKTFKSFSIISQNHKLVAELREKRLFIVFHRYSRNLTKWFGVAHPSQFNSFSVFFEHIKRRFIIFLIHSF
jgi:hypothetical protein